MWTDCGDLPIRGRFRGDDRSQSHPTTMPAENQSSNGGIQRSSKFGKRCGEKCNKQHPPCFIKVYSWGIKQPIIFKPPKAQPLFEKTNSSSSLPPKKWGKLEDRPSFLGVGFALAFSGRVFSRSV